jgi:hypothetical protein
MQGKIFKKNRTKMRAFCMDIQLKSRMLSPMFFFFTLIVQGLLGDIFPEANLFKEYHAKSYLLPMQRIRTISDHLNT